MEISKYLRQHSRTIAGKSQLFINSYAKALEVRLLVCLDVLLLYHCYVLYAHVLMTFNACTVPLGIFRGERFTVTRCVL